MEGPCEVRFVAYEVRQEILQAHTGQGRHLHVGC